MSSRKKPSVPVATVALVVLTTLTWWAFLGWDTTRDIDPATGESSGPYGTLQVVACAVVLVALVVAGTLVLPAWIAVLGVSLPFTIAWTVQAATTDDSGLFAIGAMLLLTGTLGGGAIVAAVTRAVARSRKPVTH